MDCESLAPLAEHVLAHAQLYSVATCTGQLTLGLFLLVGLLSRTSAALALLGHLLVGLLIGPRLFDSATILLALSLLSLSLVTGGTGAGAGWLAAQSLAAVADLTGPDGPDQHGDGQGGRVVS
jgi:hypothetical protein